MISSSSFAQKQYHIEDIITDNEAMKPASECYGDWWSAEKIHYMHSDSLINIFTDTSFYLDIPLKAHGDYEHPFPGYVTSPFGVRRYRFHYGTDIKVHTGDTMVAAFDGMIRVKSYNRGYGNLVVIRHYNGLETLYGHLSKILVDTNEVVKAGDAIGLGGNTGRSTGSHLHYEIRYLGVAINPEDIVDMDTGELLHDTLVLTDKVFSYQKRLQELREAKYIKIKPGDCLSIIARRYGTSVSKLCQLNGISRTSILRVGQRLRVR
ncbi:MAG: M23 family metallopeptidase [Bacteroidales bacterium]|nr:M23 family metallopeptidase [Bacteroidales bacterium]